MTWVIGTPTMCGYGFALSDIRVTLGSEEVDCLQKIFPIGRHLAAGFAGSVAIGFRMIDELRRLSNFQDERIACDPAKVAEQWPQCARAIFDSSPRNEQDLHSHLMLICAHPQEHNGNPAWPRCHVMIFKSPQFNVEPVQVHTLGSIGCGDNYEKCRGVLERFRSDYKFRELLMQGEVGRSGGMGTMIGLNLTSTLQEVQPRGVSSHLHYCWVYRGRTVIETNNHTTKGRWSIVPLGADYNAMKPGNTMASGHRRRCGWWDEYNRKKATQYNRNPASEYNRSGQDVGPQRDADIGRSGERFRNLL